MSERYWITGVQLGILIALENEMGRSNLVDNIVDKQFIGNKEDLHKLLGGKKKRRKK